MRNAECPSTLGGLRRFKDQLPIDALKCLGHTQCPSIQINITPAEAQHLPFPQPHHECDAKHGRETMRLGHSENLSCRRLSKWLTSSGSCLGASTRAATLRVRSCHFTAWFNPARSTARIW